MNWSKFLTYGDSQQNAFETLCNHLFEKYLRHNYDKELTKFRVINGAGGDGGIEAYGELISEEIIAIQAKWFRNVLQSSEIQQIRKSITTAMSLRPKIKEYIICIPHDVSSLKYGRGKKGEGKKVIENYEEKTIDDFTSEIETKYPNLKIMWWFEKDIENELQQVHNEGIHKYWFDKEVISLNYLKKQFNLSKKGWLNSRYIPELHGQGIIQQEYNKICFSSEYRKKLLGTVLKIKNDINFCIVQINKHIKVSDLSIQINDDLNQIKNNLIVFYDHLQKVSVAIETGNEHFKLKLLPKLKLQKVIDELNNKKNLNNIQKSIIPQLISALEKVMEYDLEKFVNNIELAFIQSIRLILGEPGTGKTHGLTNCVENHLIKNLPAIIIQAKGTPSKNWTQILGTVLETNDWKKEDILSAFETLTIKNDICKVRGRQTLFEDSKALICIDGLEEDIDNKQDWYSRIRESEELAIQYPRVRFMFSARKYFYEDKETPKHGAFQKVVLPQEGDVRVIDVAEKYFSPKYYNIKIPSFSVIRSIDSLLALRLFCDEYKNQEISETEKIVTATRDLIKLKIDRLNKEYSSILQQRIGSTRNPILDSLQLIADYFYTNPEIEHNELIELISPRLDSYLNVSEIDSLIDYLTDNAFLTQFSKIDDNYIFDQKKHYYNITYQSLIEHIISEKIYHKIKKGDLKKIPLFLLKPFTNSTNRKLGHFNNQINISHNEKIIQNIVNNLLSETNQLIGENEYLIDGLEDWEIKKYQFTALKDAPQKIALNYKSKIDKLFHSNHINLANILKYLILPSSSSSMSFFGADYLHITLSNIPSTFERDRLWSGLDIYEKEQLNKNDKYQYDRYNLGSVLEEFISNNFEILKGKVHNETPLVFAWGLSTIHQQLRSKLRIALTYWAIENVNEFILLLDKIFHCKNPQIQEDLASITLGVASKVKDKDSIFNLSIWAINNVFNNSEYFRNIIVRQGFRAIIERGGQFGVITKDVVEKCRPQPMQSRILLDFEKDLVFTGELECYPIVHDLAWYVLGKSYEKFLESPLSEEAKTLLDEYKLKYNLSESAIGTWGISIAIAYIKSLGFTRKRGNSFTKATHGSKSNVFTYEEKYTWLAVHFIQGYLSDYVPMKDWNDEQRFVSDYTELTNIPNPAEEISNTYFDNEKIKLSNNWVIKEILTKEINKECIDIKKDIKEWVTGEPDFNLENWLNYESIDFNLNEENRKWTAIYNQSSLYDSNQYCYSNFSLTACLIKKGDLLGLKKIVNENPDSLYFTSNLNDLHSSPKTDTYCNPTDIIWMNWIEENEPCSTFYDNLVNKEKSLIHSITRIITEKINSESYLRLPSKKIRELINCCELLNDELKDSMEKTVAFNHKIYEEPFPDSQEIVLVDSQILYDAIENEGYEIIWFGQLFRQQNPLNKSLDKEFVQRVRKYFIWNEDGDKKSFKFWDEYFNNRRDKDLENRPKNL